MNSSATTLDNSQNVTSASWSDEMLENTLMLAAPTLDPADVDQQYSYWRKRILLGLIIGYSAFYCVRQNFTLAVPSMLAEFSLTKTQIGWVFTAFSLVYGVSKFISGSLIDRANARYYMAIGLAVAAGLSLVMGISESFILIGLMYVGNGFFQSMGWPPITRLLTQWYGPSQIGTRWGLVSASHQIGAAIILLGGPLLIVAYSWRTVFIVPGIACLAAAWAIFAILRDTPKSLGLPTIEQKEAQHTGTPCVAIGDRPAFKEIFMTYILPNKALWCICWANFFIYMVRMSFFNWAPTFLQEAKGVTLTKAGWQISAFEIAGIIGGLLAGWLSDRYFPKQRNWVNVIFMAALTGAIIVFRLAPNAPGIDTLLLTLIGFLVYGPQTLVGLSAAEYGTRHAAGTANGLNGTFGYLGAAVSGVGVGYVADRWGWDATIGFYIACSVIGMILFAITTRLKAPASA